MNSKGKQVKYKKSDLDYDQKNRFIIARDIIPSKTQPSKTPKERHDRKQQLTIDEWRRKWKDKQET